MQKIYISDSIYNKILKVCNLLETSPDEIVESSLEEKINKTFKLFRMKPVESGHNNIDIIDKTDSDSTSVTVNKPVVKTIDNRYNPDYYTTQGYESL
jgi:hypothetical protein